MNKVLPAIIKMYRWVKSNKGCSLVLLVIFIGLLDRDNLFSAVFYASLLYSFMLISSVVKSKNEYRDRKALDLKTPELLDKLVNETFDQVVLFDPNYSGPDVHISSKDELMIQSKLIDELSKKLSPAIQKKLVTYYGDDYIAEAISNKIYLSVTAYAIEKNKLKDDVIIKPKKPETKNILDQLL